MADRVDDNLQGVPPPPYSASKDQHTEQPDACPPPYHNWQDAVPDTSIYPPPPVTSYLYSGTGNASEDDAVRAHDFCNGMPLWNPERPSSTVYNTVQVHDLKPVQPREFHGQLSTTNPGKWKARTRDKNGDCVLLTHLPVYFPTVDSPLVTKKMKIIYFEVKLQGLYAGPGTSQADGSGFSLGYAARPYPSWRSPGWERGSLGVFSDDGCRFVNDSWGGKVFMPPFNERDTVGIGMKFMPQASLQEKRLEVEVFCTRNGRLQGGWNLYEEMDEEAGAVTGLEGDFDLYGAVGFFGGVELEIYFDPADWLWSP